MQIRNLKLYGKRNFHHQRFNQITCIFLPFLFPFHPQLMNSLSSSQAMTILSKIKGSNCWLQTTGSNKMIEFTDWLITFEYHNLLKLEVSPDSFFEERRKQVLGVEKESPPPSAAQSPSSIGSPSSQSSPLVNSPLYNVTCSLHFGKKTKTDESC